MGLVSKDGVGGSVVVTVKSVVGAGLASSCCKYALCSPNTSGVSWCSFEIWGHLRLGNLCLGSSTIVLGDVVDAGSELAVLSHGNLEVTWFCVAATKLSGRVTRKPAVRTMLAIRNDARPIHAGKSGCSITSAWSHLSKTKQIPRGFQTRQNDSAVWPNAACELASLGNRLRLPPSTRA